MMHGHETSDLAIVAVKPTNKAEPSAAEPVEPRAGTKRNVGQPSTRRAQNRENVPHALDRIREAAKQRKKKRFTALYHLLDPDLFQDAFFELKDNAAAGVDGLTWWDYEKERHRSPSAHRQRYWAWTHLKSSSALQDKLFGCACLTVIGTEEFSQAVVLCSLHAREEFLAAIIGSLHARRSGVASSSAKLQNWTFIDEKNASFPFGRQRLRQHQSPGRAACFTNLAGRSCCPSWQSVIGTSRMGLGSRLFKASNPDPHGAPRLLVSYYPLGDPLIGPDLLDVYCDCGVDIVEIGMASANPHLDGAPVRQSMARSRAAAPRPALDMLLDRLSRRGRAPRLLVMTYADADHPALGYPGFWDGIDGLMVVAPPQDPIRQSLERQAAGRGLAVSTFVTRPAAPADHAAARSADGYVMLQAAAGLTGPRTSLDPGNRDIIADLRVGGVSAPILLGFGISDGRQAAQALSLGADGIVVGSRCLAAALEGRLALRAALDDLRQGLDGAPR